MPDQGLWSKVVYESSGGLLPNEISTEISRGITTELQFHTKIRAMFFFLKNHVKTYPPCNEKRNFNLEQPDCVWKWPSKVFVAVRYDSSPRWALLECFLHSVILSTIMYSMLIPYGHNTQTVVPIVCWLLVIHIVRQTFPEEYSTWLRQEETLLSFPVSRLTHHQNHRIV